MKRTLWLLFSVLFICLFLGDGKQTIVDVVGAGLVLALFILCFFYLHKQREIDKISTWLWLVFLVYIALRMVFSGDVGYSLFVVLRYVDAFLLYYLFACYSSESTRATYASFLLGFCAVALFCAATTMLFPRLFSGLPLMNLLSLSYGHNHVVDILLFGFPVALMKWIQTKQRKYLLLLALFFVGTIFSFARAALIVEAALLSVFLLYTRGQVKQKTTRTLLLIFILFCSVVAVVLFFFPYQQLKGRSAILPQYDKQNDVSVTRGEFWNQSMQAIKKNPLFGSGPGTFFLASKQYQSAQNKYSWFAHNYPLEFVVENGFVGLLLLLVLGLRLLFLMNLQPERYKKCLFISLCVVLFYGLIDYSLSYLVCIFLFWTTVGLLSWNPQSAKRREKNNPLATLALVGLSVMYGVTTLAFSRTIPYINLLFVAEASTNIEKNTVTLAEVLHRENPEVLLAVAEFYSQKNLPAQAEEYFQKAIERDPPNVGYYKKYIEHLLKYNNLNKLSSVVFSYMGSHIKYEMKRDIEKINTFSLEEAQMITKENYENLFDEAHAHEIRFAGLLYFLGVKQLKTTPLRTAGLWAVLPVLDPGFSHYYVEAASLYKYAFGDNEKANSFLTRCLLNDYSRDHCKTLTIETLPQPGYYANESKLFNAWANQQK